MFPYADEFTEVDLAADCMDRGGEACREDVLRADGVEVACHFVLVLRFRCPGWEMSLVVCLLAFPCVSACRFGMRLVSVKMVCSKLYLALQNTAQT